MYLYLFIARVQAGNTRPRSRERADFYAKQDTYPDRCAFVYSTIYQIAVGPLQWILKFRVSFFVSAGPSYATTLAIVTYSGETGSLHWNNR
jgi:hypothetical protein